MRETYSALECLWQARRAADPIVRATMERIAADEMRHLSLSWAVHAWATSRLGGKARAHLREAQREQLLVLASEVATDPAPPLVAIAGLPRATQSRALVETIAAQLQVA